MTVLIECYGRRASLLPAISSWLFPGARLVFALTAFVSIVVAAITFLQARRITRVRV